MHRRLHRLTAALLVAAVAVTSCGGKSAAPESSSKSEPGSAGEVAAPSGTTDPDDGRAPSASASAVADTSETANTPERAETPTTPGTTAKTLPLAPLTGLPVDDPLLANRPAIVVKIDGHLQARPQWGIDEADVVIEEIVEGITRYMAVFHSVVPEVVGPIRSARTQDMLIAPMLDTPLFVWSGGNAKVTAVVRKGPVVNISATHGWRLKGVWFRTKKRKGPHNLLAHGEAVLALAPEDARAPRPLFSFRTTADDVGGSPVSGVRIQMSGTRAQWVWNADRSLWERTADGKVHVAESGNRVSAANVVVLEVKYRSSAADPNSPEAQTVGTGKALVFTAGRLIVGTWVREKGADPWTLLDETGAPIRLTPGRTWVELAKSGRSAIIDVGVDPKDVRWKAA